MPAVTAGLGGVILAAEAIDGDLTSGLVWSAILAALGALQAFGGRFEAVRQARGEEEDEREAMINIRALALAGTVLVIVLTAASSSWLAARARARTRSSWRSAARRTPPRCSCSAGAPERPKPRAEVVARTCSV
jgi:hypothetical protein